MVDVKELGNVADTTGFGSVSYQFSISKYQVTIGQYCEFLNAVASIEDTYDVYTSSMGENSNIAGIKRALTNERYSYSIVDNQGNSSARPVTYIDWFRAARFANWMSNGQPSGTLQDSTSTENGAYTLEGAVDGNAKALNPVNPNTNGPPAFYIAREDEWYKAAYYDPRSNNGQGGYYSFATRSDIAPGNDIGSSSNQANYITLPDGLLSTTQSPNFDSSNYLTDVGAFTESYSYYGTFDQNGNVWEWCDVSEITGYRFFRGGAWTSYSSYLASSYRLGALTHESSFNSGFRLASQPGDIVFPPLDSEKSPTPGPEVPSPPPTPSQTPSPTPPNELIRIETVLVGNSGNIPEPQTLFGSVDYEFEIGKYMVTIGQYCAFLNAVAKDDTFNLYNDRMASDLNVAGIERTGAAGSFSYSVITNNNGSSENRPIAYVSFFDAARFANWLSNGQPTGEQNDRTTESGAYPLYGAIAGVVPSRSTVNPNTGEPPAFYIPLENEWYKAGFFDPDINDGSGGYWSYATQSNDAPGNVVGSTKNQVNYIANSLYSVTQQVQYVASQNYLTEVGAFSQSQSYYNTFDQNGNLGEWNNADGSPNSSQGTRGNFWASALNGLRSFAYVSASQESNDLGFRVARPAPRDTTTPCPSIRIDPGCTCSKPFWHPKRGCTAARPAMKE
ncbi:hypothetical protein PSENEW3n2_00001809 [Picochlorum sp. SENEW3]|nr:hypothetical protein PSENEW3n2_00001809 [Picochlorum sp. SENEW3]WPT14579.1 hypothetical protein PSENEW3_00001809 [Picochlorum sp. SENEW3]